MTVAKLTPSPRHPWELLLAQLSGLSGLVHVWGTEADAKSASDNHITWIPKKIRFEKRPFAVGGTVTDQVLALPHAVMVYGGSPAVVIQRVADLVGQLANIASLRQGNYGDALPPLPGYDVSGGDEVVMGGQLGAGMWLAQPTITLKAFVYAQIYGQASAQSVSVTTSASVGGVPQVGVEATS